MDGVSQSEPESLDHDPSDSHEQTRVEREQLPLPQLQTPGFTPLFTLPSTRIRTELKDQRSLDTSMSFVSNFAVWKVHHWTLFPLAHTAVIESSSCVPGTYHSDCGGNWYHLQLS